MTGSNANDTQYAVTIDGKTDHWRVVRFHGTEAVSSLFHFTVDVVHDEGVAPESLINTTTVLQIAHAGADRFIHGIISAVQETESGTYHLTVVPRVYPLLHVYDCRIFQQKKVPDIIKEVLQHHNIQGDQVDLDQLTASLYKPRDYCVQYRESDWAFISRLLEEEGIFYFFDHTDSDHKLIFGDKSQVHVPIDGDDSSLPLSSDVGFTGREQVEYFRYGVRMGTGHVSTQEYDFVQPTLPMLSDAKGSVYSDLEAYDYPGDYEAPAAGKHLAKIRLEEHATQYQLAGAQSNCARLMAGRKFTLEDSEGLIRSELAQHYVLLSVTHRGHNPYVGTDGGGGDSGTVAYENDFDALPLTTVFRPLRHTPRPVVHGVQTAIVVGPNGQEIYTDEHGRVKVQFHWDRKGQKNEHSSCWIRVSQAWAGEGWGFMAIPRIGHEVVVGFLEGNPDRPIITGRVYHGTNKPPYTLPDRATVTAFKSNSSQGGGGFNELTFEDAKGSEYIYLHGEKDWNIEIKNDKTQQVGHDESLNVKHDRTKEVGNDQHEKIDHDKTIQVGHDHTESIGNDCTISIAGNRTESVTKDSTLGVDGNSATTVKGSMNVTVMKSKTERVLITSEEDVGAAKSLAVGGAYAVTVGASYSNSVVGSMGIASGGATQVTANGNLILKTGADATLDASKKMTVHSGDELGIATDKKMSVQAKEDMSVGSEKKLMIQAADEVTIKCGDATVVLKKSGDVEINGGKITIKGSGDVKVQGSKIGLN